MQQEWYLYYKSSFASKSTSYPEFNVDFICFQWNQLNKNVKQRTIIIKFSRINEFNKWIYKERDKLKTDKMLMIV